MEAKPQTVKLPAGHQVLQEGRAYILYKEERLEVDKDNMIHTNKGKSNANDVNTVRGAVFYNPVQEFNRDISILVIREFIKLREEECQAKQKEFKGVDVLEALAATGLRSVRYLKEIDKINQLVANDIDPTATELMQRNFNFNNIPEDQYKSNACFLFIGDIVHTSDAIDLMNTMRKDK